MCDRPNREEAMTVIRRNDEGTPTVWCDPCIAPLVEALQGVGTVASCCGHGRRPASISLKDGREVLVMNYDAARRIDGLWFGINDEPPRSVLAAIDGEDTDGN